MDERNHLGLPKAITRGWKPVEPYENPDANVPPDVPHPFVYPANIPARDQVLAYAATLGQHYEEFKSIVNHRLGTDAGPALARLSRTGKIVWQAYAFLAHGGNAYDPKKSLREQVTQHFGINTAVGYIVHSTQQQGSGAVDLNRVFLDKDLNHSAWVQSAKVRAVETLLLERLFVAVSQLTVVEQ